MGSPSKVFDWHPALPAPFMWTVEVCLRIRGLDGWSQDLRVFLWFIQLESSSAVGGLEIGAIPLGTAISDFAYTASPSQDSYAHSWFGNNQRITGLGKLLEGAIRPGDHALIVDDVLTSGGSLIKAIHAAREAGLNSRART